MKKAFITSLIAAAAFTAMPLINAPEAYKAAGSKIIFGDADRDGVIDSFDVALIRREAASPGSTRIDLAAADVNADGVIDVKDAAAVQDYVLGRIESFTAVQTGIYSGRTEGTFSVLVGKNSKLYFSVTSKAPVAFDDHYEGDMTLVGAFLSPEDTEIEVPATVEMQNVIYNVLSISEDSFNGQTKLEKISLDEKIDSIGDKAFKDCTALHSVYMSTSGGEYDPRELYSLGNEAFSGCTSLSYFGNIKIIKHFGDYVFRGCESLTNFHPEQTVSMGKGVFSGTGVSTVRLTDTELTEIPDETFLNCKKLSWIYFPEKTKIKRIGVSAFENCSELNIDSYTERLSELTVIDDRAFFDCKSLMYVPWDKETKLEKLGIFALAGCEKLEKADLSNFDIDVINSHTFEQCINLRKVTLPKHLKSIDYKAFNNCTDLQSIYMPDGFETVGNCAFEMCSELETVMLPESTKEIGNNAFNYCMNMKYFVLKNPETTIGETAIGYQTYHGSVHGKTKEFTIFGNGGTAEKYAEENGFDYKSVSDTKSRRETVMAKDTSGYTRPVETFTEEYSSKIWCHTNNSSVYLDKKLYYMYVEELSEYYGVVLNDTTKKSNGICYGLASISTMAMNGDIDTSSWNSYLGIPEGESIFKMYNPPKKLAILINAIWSRGTCGEQSYCFSNNDISYGDHDHPTTDYEKKELFTYLEYTNYGADLPVISMICDSLRHAVSVVEYEENKDGFWKVGNDEYNVKLYVYDNNSEDHKLAGYYEADETIVYINTETGLWKYLTNKSDEDEKSAIFFDTDPDLILKTSVNDYYFKTADDYLNGILNAISKLD